MTNLKWLTLGTLLILGSSNLFGDNQQNSRHFNINPNDMMGGMMNPMRNMFGGYDRNQGGYNDYYYDPYYAPQPYAGYPQNYSYPDSYYAQPPATYNAPANQYPNYQEYQQPSPTPDYTERTIPGYPPAPAARANSQFRQGPGEQFQFRPIERQPTQNRGQNNTYYQQAPSYESQTPPDYYYDPNPTNYPQGHNQQQPTEYPLPPQGASNNYTPYNEASNLVEPTMKFRPLDQPGYSQ